MKKTPILLLTVILSLACTLGALVPIPTLTPAPTQTDTASPLPSSTPASPFLTYTYTPTLIGLKTPTLTPVDTATLLPTDTPPPATFTPTPLPPVNIEGFVFVNISLTEIYKAKGCEPSVVRITAQTDISSGVEFVFLFARFKSMKAERIGKWTNIPMTLFGAGTYIHDLSSDQIREDAYFDTSWIEYQIVSATKSGREIGRTDIFKERLKMLACVPTATPTAATVSP
jgi:hypothetical protein